MLRLTNVFKSFHNKCIKIYEINSAHFWSAPGLACQACLKKSEVESKLLTYVGMLLYNENSVKCRMCQFIHWQVRANNKYMRDYDSNKESLFHVLRREKYPWMQSVTKVH